MLCRMMTDIKTALREEAVRFADKVHDLMIAQLTSALGAVTSTPPQPQKQPPVRTAARREKLAQETVEEALAQIIKLLEKHAEGLRSEQIRAELGMDKKLFQYAANLGKTSDQLTQAGERRSTVYSIPARPSKAQEEGRVVKRRRKK